jgi:uncharacterized protein with NRDE domain
MSLISIAWRAHPDFPLVLLFNRAADHELPTAPAQWWPSPDGLLAGRDLAGGGTWLGVKRQDGRFALVTGFREATPAPSDAPSRGGLPLAYLESDEDPVAHARRYARSKAPWAPFNLIVGNPRQAYYVATRSRVSLALTEGIHSLSNGLLDQRWPNTERQDAVFGAYIKAVGGFVTLLDGYPRLRDVMAARDYAMPMPEDEMTPQDIAAAGMAMLADRTMATAGLPDTGLDAEEEQRRSAPFVVGEAHGTRSSTVLVMARDGRVYFEERSVDAAGDTTGSVVQQWQQSADAFGAGDLA